MRTLTQLYNFTMPIPIDAGRAREAHAVHSNPGATVTESSMLALQPFPHPRHRVPALHEVVMCVSCDTHTLWFQQDAAVAAVNRMPWD